MILTMPDFFNEIMKKTAGVAPQPPSKKEGEKSFKKFTKLVEYLTIMHVTLSRNIN
jgi:hypothetical protein